MCIKVVAPHLVFSILVISWFLTTTLGLFLHVHFFFHTVLVRSWLHFSFVLIVIEWILLVFVTKFLNAMQSFSSIFSTVLPLCIIVSLNLTKHEAYWSNEHNTSPLAIRCLIILIGLPMDWQNLKGYNA